LWIGGTDQVGVYCVESTGGNVNIPYTASSTAFSSAFTGAMKWGTTDPHLFYAYYPYLAGSAATTEVPITLYADQYQSAGNSSSHIGNYDFMVATPVSQTPDVEGTSTSVNLRYNHVFTILEFQIKGTGTLYAVSLTVPITDPPSSPPIAFSDYNSYTIDIAQTPEIGDAYIIVKSAGTDSEINEVIVWLDTPATLSPTTATSVYMVINPGTQTDDCIIGLDLVGDGTMTYSISKAAPVITSDPLVKGFSRGKKYVVPIDLRVTDVDNNVYNTITIGTQFWMAENLKTTKYNDGTAITNVPEESTWATLTTEAYCWYNNDGATYKATYGALYNWYAVDATSNGGRNICPVGWHVPTDDEWTTLTTYLGGVSTNVAKALAAKTNWSTSDIADAVGNDLTINNSSGFTALPGGYRSFGDGNFYNVGNTGYWWSSTAGAPYPWTRALEYNYATVYSNNSNPEKFGVSVRCMRD